MGRIARVLTHRCTIAEPAAGVDDWNADDGAAADPVVDIACLLRETRERVLRDQDAESAHILEFKLYLEPDQPITKRSIVTNIINAAGEVLQAGPFTVGNLSHHRRPRQGAHHKTITLKAVG